MRKNCDEILIDIKSTYVINKYPNNVGITVIRDFPTKTNIFDRPSTIKDGPGFSNTNSYAALAD